MSLSKTEDNKFYTGRVIMGLDSNNKTQEMSIQEMEGKKKPTWNEDTDREYYERVKAKAQNMAKEIIAKAMTEAEQIRANAQAEGYSAGQQQAAIQNQSHNVMMAQSADAISLVFMVIEKTLAVEMEARRQEILASLLDDALNRIDSMTQLVIKVSPADSEIIGPLLEQARTEHPDLDKWRVKADPAIDNGGVIVEAADAMIENTVTSRWEGVQEILGQLTPGIGE
ncbi:hypothetical protein ADUPG1_002403, partial [Aduncisulcus paluster]